MIASSYNEGEYIMRLTRFSITGFRSYQTSQVLDIDSNITILAGRNNVGKTAILRALRLPVETVPGVLNGFQAKYVWTASREDWCEVFETLQTALHASGVSENLGQLDLEVTYRSADGLGSLSIAPSDAGFQPVWQWQGGIGPVDMRFTNTPLHARAYANGSAVALWWDRIPNLSQEDHGLLLGGIGSFSSGNLYQSYYIQPRRIGA
jgi:AAA ATPase domain